MNPPASRARRVWRYVAYSLRIRRVEYRVAELPIFFIPVLLTISDPSELAGATLWEGLLTFLFLFAFGDLLNCLADRELDALYKPHLSEAVYGIGVRGVVIQAVGSALAAAGIAAHLAWRLGRWELLLLVLVGLVVAWAYSVEPVRLKGRGLWQLAFYWVALFTGPMIFAALLFDPTPALPVVVVAAAFGLVQTGIILVNTAEDYPEDRAMKVRTVIVALGLGPGMRLAVWMTVIGGGVLVTALGWISWTRDAGAWGAAALVPLLAAWVYASLSIARLRGEVRRADGDRAVEAVKEAAKRVPLWITSVALASFVAALAVFLTSGSRI